ncbi:MAG: tRNA 2-thiocytidine(32) synthetase TtcA [Deltaproteobacteria bacterium]|nr:MAG: tRNA 2-thiocytidine(32) synthetase TtcA [Deltaproteobacteria bacterium]
MAYLEREIRKLVGKAIHRYRLIDDGDRILVALSGGKDSLVMLKLLHERRSRVPIEYELKVITVDLGYEGGNLEALEEYVRGLGCDYSLKKTRIGPLAHSPTNRENPCFLCARLRRKVIFETARELGCNKVALGHNRDDIIETFLLNVFYCGEISTMVPHQVLFGGKLSIIRPLSLVEEDKIRAYAKLQGFPEVYDGCPTKALTRRKEIKFLLGELDRMDKRIRRNIFRALSNIRLEYLLVNGTGATS